jgi:hypothetical protein
VGKGGGILKKAMETRQKAGAGEGYDRLIRVKKTRAAGDPTDPGLITVLIFVFRDNPLKYTDPDGRMPGQPFDTADGAAVDALDHCNPKSKDENIEYAGIIYQDPATGKYYATEPKNKSSGVRSNPGTEPKGTKRVGEYHTHGEYSLEGPGGNPIKTGDPSLDDYDSDNFNNNDKGIIQIRETMHPGLKGYLGTPSDKYKKYDPVTDKITEIPANRFRIIPKAY